MLAAMGALVAAPLVHAEDGPPRVGPYVIDIRGAIPQFPQAQGLADSRGLALTQLPGSGLGLDLGAHVYPLHWRAVTFGVGGEAMLGRAQTTPPAVVGAASPSSVTERLTSYGPQVSFNFGGLNGWSYLSGGVGWSTWSIVDDGAVDPLGPGGADLPQNHERLKTISYGGGARWLAKRRVGVSVDVRFYAINPGLANGSQFKGSPRTTLLIISAGIAIR